MKMGDYYFINGKHIFHNTKCRSKILQFSDLSKELIQFNVFVL